MKGMLEVECASWLREPHLRNPVKAVATAQAIGEMLLDSGQAARWLPLLVKHAMASCDPDRALNNWERFVRTIPSVTDFLDLLNTSPQMLPALTTLFAGSQYLTDMVFREPGIVEWLDAGQRLAMPRAQEDMARDLMDGLGHSLSLEDKLRVLRRFRRREMVRIGLRDLLRQADLVETTEELSHLADVCLAGAYEACMQELIARYGEPMGSGEAGEAEPSEFAILGLGKLGGLELNFSSDIDLMFLYSIEGETTGVAGHDGKMMHQITNHEFFTRLARLLLKGIHEITPDGNVYRVDLRLRPEGRGGPIVNSIRNLEVYYESWGQTWERQMLLKARGVAGSARLGREFLRTIHPFIFRRYLDVAALQEIKQIKEQIDRSLERRRARGINIKLGWGGIREIEFVAQCFQLILGGQDNWLYERNTLRALHRISERGYLSYEEYADLAKAYIFFRALEHRVQIAHGRQTHEIPVDVDELAILARRMGLRGPDPEALGAVLLQQFRDHTTKVRRVYDKLFYGDFLEVGEDAAPEWYTLAAGIAPARSLLEQFQFGDPEKTYRNLLQLHDGRPSIHPTAKSKQLFRQLCSTLLRVASEQPDPDLAINNLEQFVASIPARESLFRLWLDNEAVLRVVLSLFGNSVFLAKRLIQQPELLDTLLDPASLTKPKAKETMHTELAILLEKSSRYDAKLDAIRRFKRAEEFRIGLREIAGEADILQTMRDLSNLADVSLDAVLRVTWPEWARRFELPEMPEGEGFVIVGLGKLGGRELDFASDLDLLFVSADTIGDGAATRQFAYNKLAELLVQAIGGMSRYGALFRVDMGLRPEGNKGPLVSSLGGLREYYFHRGQLWERQALLRARPVAGDAVFARRVIRVVEACAYERPLAADVVERIDAMRRRIERERVAEGEKRWDIKLGYGGLADIEFLVQLYQLLFGGVRPALRIPSTWDLLEVLNQEGLLRSHDAQTLQESYCFLRRVESALRIVDDRSVNCIPERPVELRRLARRLGYEARERVAAEQALLSEVQACTAHVRGLYERLTQGLRGKRLSAISGENDA